MNQNYYSVNHVFTSRNSEALINIKPGINETLNITGAQINAGGDPTQIQFNNAGTLDGIPSFTYDNNEVVITEPLTVNHLNIDPTGLINFTAGTQPDYAIEDQEYMYRDIEIQPVAKTTGPNSPNFEVWKTGQLAYNFATTGSGLFYLYYTLHIPHDFDVTRNEGIFFHCHTVSNYAGPYTGTSYKLTFEYSYASSFGIFTTNQKVSVVDTPTAQYEHRIAEIPAPVLAGLLEVDGIISISVYRDVADVDDTFPGDVFILFVDAHISVNKHGTLNRNKAGGSFYV